MTNKIDFEIIGKAVEKALANTVDKHGDIMTDTFELHESYSKDHPCNMHFLYEDPETGKKAVRIFYNIPEYSQSRAFRDKMSEVKAWVVLLGQLRKSVKKGESVISNKDMLRAMRMLDKNNVPGPYRVLTHPSTPRTKP